MQEEASCPELEPELKQSIDESKRQLQSLINCHICYDKVNNATMCPYCSKLYCQGCIGRSLRNKQQCPNCRKSLKSIPIIHCGRFITQLGALLQDLIQHKSLDQKCPIHSVLQNYYCQQCTLPICCECQMFGSHKGHQIQQLKLVYDKKCEKIKQQLSFIKKHMKVKQGILKDIQQKNGELKKERDRRLCEIQENTQFYRLKVLNQVSTEEKFLREYSQMIGEEVLKVEELEKMIKKKLVNPQKLGQLTQAEEEEIKEVCQKEFVNPNAQQKLNFIHQLIPPYQQCEFVIENFTKRRQSRDIVYSPVLQQQGLQWRLKIYPNGNQTVQGTHLSVFLELLSSIRKKNLYQYQIQLINHRCPQGRMMREYSSDFEPGECWGYNKYISLEKLVTEGFLNPADDSLRIRYYVRQPSYYEMSIHKRMFGDFLDNQIGRQEEEIKHLEEILANQAGS